MKKTNYFNKNTKGVEDESQSDKPKNLIENEYVDMKNLLRGCI
jgi:hypothetical protein